MENSVFAYVRKYGRSQIILILLIMLPMFGLQILMYQLPKQIIDDAIGGGSGNRSLFGFEFEQLDYLWLLCGAFLLLVLIIGGIKFVVQTMKGIMAERLLRRLRFQLLSRTMRFPLRHFRKTSQNEVVTMVTAEVEPLGGFFGEAYIQPAFQGGIFLVVLIFLFSQNVVLGLVASMSMPIQAWVVPYLQKRIRLLGKERVKAVRALSERVGETITGIEDLHANDGIRYAQSDFSSRLGKIFQIRYEIYRRKFFMKFLNNFINQLTPFFFYSVGGYLVITGSLSIGALTAGLVAYKDLAAPWKELLNWYQLQADATVKYDSLLEQFQPADMVEPAQQEGKPEHMADWGGRDLMVSGLSLQDEDEVKQVDHTSALFKAGESVLITGSSTGGKLDFAALLSGLIKPSSGQVRVGQEDLGQLHRSVTGSRIAYVGPEGTVFSGSLKDNLLLGLKRYPQAVNKDKGLDDADFVKEAKASGNSELPFQVDWLTLEEVGLADEAALLKQCDFLIHLLGMENYLYESGMLATVTSHDHPELTAGILKARHLLTERLVTEEAGELIRRFSASKFNRYASVAENIIYGQPVDATFAFDRLGENEYIHQLIESEGLAQDFLDMGIRLARLMVEMFQGAELNDFFHEQFSFVETEDLPILSKIIRRYDKEGEPSISQTDRKRLYSLVFHLTPQRHRLDLIDPVMEKRLVGLRHAFHAELPPVLQDKIIFLEEEEYNPGLTLQGNILFGRIAHGRAQAEQRMAGLLEGIINELALRPLIIRAALGRDVGKGGSRLPMAQRQLLVLARALLKNPHIIIVNEALSALSSAEREVIAKQLTRHFDDRIVIWVDQQPLQKVAFDQRLEMEKGRLYSADGRALSTDSGAASPDQPVDEDSGISSTLASEVGQLQRVPLFAGLNRQHLRLLAFTSEVIRFEAGEMVFHQNDVGECAYVILRGEGEILLEHDGWQKKINHVEENALVGEMALLGDADTHRSASFLALSDMECLKISREVFVELIQQNASIAMHITRLLSQRLQNTLSLLDAAKKDEIPDKR